MTQEEIFAKAIDLPADQQSAFLDGAFHERPEDRAKMEAMLAAHRRSDSLLDIAEGNTDSTESHVRSIPELLEQIGNYKLLQKIGEGGFGVVYMAEQLRPIKRKVALKVIKPGMDSDAVIARFEAERQALAMMDHANIARVFDGGVTDQGRPYFVMELVKGVPITNYCDDNHLRTSERLQLFIDVCKAVKHAHQKGIIHRDIKPSNVMVTLHDGQPVIKVIDFGVAKAMHVALTERTLFTAFGQIIGTPQYMSPEQAEMSGLDVDTRSDVYSLGVLLYELLTGSTPLEAEVLRTAGYAGMQKVIKETEPPRPSVRLSSSGEKLTHIAKHRSVSPEKLRTEVKGDLDWIVMKALEKDRNRRYDSAASLASDVARLLSGEAILARPYSSYYLISKVLRRNRRVVVAAGLASAGLLIGLLLAAVEFVRKEQLNRELQDRDYVGTMHDISHAWDIGDLRRMQEGLNSIEEPAKRESFESQFFTALFNLSSQNTTQGARVTASADGSVVAYLSENEMELVINGNQRIAADSRIRDFAIAADGETVVIVHEDRFSIVVMSDGKWTPTHHTQFDVGVAARANYLQRIVQISPSGNLLAVLLQTPTGPAILAYRTTDGTKAWHKSLHESRFARIRFRFCHHGNQCVVATDTELLSLSAATGEPIGRVVSYSPFWFPMLETNGKDLLLTSLGDKVNLWRTNDDGNHVLLTTFDIDVPHAAAFTPDSTKLALTSRQAVVVFDISTEYPCFVTRCLHNSLVDAVCFDNAGLLYSTMAMEMKTWQIPSNESEVRKFVATENYHYFPPLAVSKTFLATASQASKILILNLRNGQLRAFDTGCDLVIGLAISPDEKHLVATSYDGHVQRWTLAAMDKGAETIYSTDSAELWAASFSTNGRFLAVCGTNGELVMWSTEDWKSRKLATRGDESLSRLAFSPSGKYLLVGGMCGSPRTANQEADRGILHVFDVQTQTILKSETRDDRIYAIEFPPHDDDKVAISVRHGNVELLELRLTNGELKSMPCQVEFSASPFFVQSLQFTADASRIVTASPNGLMRIWRVRDGTELGYFQSGRRVREIQFTEDSTKLALACQEGAVELLPTRSE